MLTYEKYYEEAENYYVKGLYGNALEVFKKAFEINQTNDCLNYIGCCYLAQKDYLSALRIFKNLIKSCPDWERPYFNLGRMYIEIGKMQKALRALEKALSINSQNEDTYFYMGVYYYEAADYNKARDFYKKSLNLNGEQPETHLNLGRCFYHLGMLEEATQEFDISYELDSECTDALFNKAMVFIATERYTEAIKVLIEINAQDTEDTEILLKIAHCYYKMNDLENALTWADKIISIDSEHNMANKLLKRLKSLKERSQSK